MGGILTAWQKNAAPFASGSESRAIRVVSRVPLDSATYSKEHTVSGKFA